MLCLYVGRQSRLVPAKSCSECSNDVYSYSQLNYYLLILPQMSRVSSKLTIGTQVPVTSLKMFHYHLDSLRAQTNK